MQYTDGACENVIIDENKIIKLGTFYDLRVEGGGHLAKTGFLWLDLLCSNPVEVGLTSENSFTSWKNFSIPLNWPETIWKILLAIINYFSESINRLVLFHSRFIDISSNNWLLIKNVSDLKCFNPWKLVVKFTLIDYLDYFRPINWFFDW